MGGVLCPSSCGGLGLFSLVLVPVAPKIERQRHSSRQSESLFGCAPKEKWARVEGGKGLDLLGGRPTDCILAKRHFFDGQGGVI